MVPNISTSPLHRIRWKIMLWTGGEKGINYMESMNICSYNMGYIEPAWERMPLTPVCSQSYWTFKVEERTMVTACGDTGQSVQRPAHVLPHWAHASYFYCCWKKCEQAGSNNSVYPHLPTIHLCPMDFKIAWTNLEQTKTHFVITLTELDCKHWH